MRDFRDFSGFSSCQVCRLAFTVSPVGRYRHCRDRTPRLSMSGTTGGLSQTPRKIRRNARYEAEKMDTWQLERTNGTRTRSVLTPTGPVSPRDAKPTRTNSVELRARPVASETSPTNEVTKLSHGFFFFFSVADGPVRNFVRPEPTN